MSSYLLRVRAQRPRIEFAYQLNFCSKQLVNVMSETSSRLLVIECGIHYMDVSHPQLNPFTVV